jgi:hypothetical protein
VGTSASSTASPFHRPRHTAPPAMIALTIVLALMIAFVAHDTADHR